jgi:hypothetical protein
MPKSIRKHFKQNQSFIPAQKTFIQLPLKLVFHNLNRYKVYLFRSHL